MKTTKPISGISYNTPAHLLRTLETLRDAGRISDAFWIEHEPDTDGKKSHFHLVAFTCGAVDPYAFARIFDEIVEGEQKPRAFKPNPEHQGKCLSVSDWLQYSIHDPFYLDCKGLVRNVHYERDAVRTLDDEHLSQCWADVPPPRVSREQLRKRFVELMAQGFALGQILDELKDGLFQHPELTNLVKTLAQFSAPPPTTARCTIQHTSRLDTFGSRRKT